MSKTPYISGFIFALVFLFVLLAFWNFGLGHFGLAKPLGRDYVLTGATSNIVLFNDGSADITESINYKFKGCYHEVFRTLDIPRTHRTSPYITSVAASCTPACSVFYRNYEIAGNFGTICDSVASFNPQFNVKNAVTVGSDVAVFHYKIWGDDWDKTLQSLQGTIELPEGVEPVSVYFNPHNVATYTIEGNLIYFEAEKVPTYLEVRLVMPRTVFSNGVLDPEINRAKIQAQQKRYAVNYNLIVTAYYLLLAMLSVSLVVVPIYLFNKFGKEPTIDYHGLFERNALPGFKPYQIGAIINAGKIKPDVVTATLLDLVRRGSIKLDETKKGSKTDTVFTFVSEKGLSPSEQIVYTYFKGKAANGKLLWSNFTQTLNQKKAGEAHIKFEKDFKASALEEVNIQEYFISKGNVIFKSFCVAIIFLSIISLMFANADNYPPLRFTLLLLPFTIGLSIIGLFLPAQIFGRFTPRGLEVYRKSLNFKKFMTDLTLLKEYPPASIVIWEEQLVYATLFGVAKKVIKNLKAVVPESKVRQGRLYHVYNLSAMNSFNAAHSVASSSSSSRSGGGGVGGGFGGGGGGAR